MEFDGIDVDEAQAARKLTTREVIGIKILMTVFSMVYPFKYRHQVKKLLSELELDQTKPSGRALKESGDE